MGRHPENYLLDKASNDGLELRGLLSPIHIPFQVACALGDGTPKQLEDHLNCDPDRNRFTIFHCRLEFIFVDCLDGFLIQPHTQASNHARILWHSLRIDYDVDKASALVVGFERLFRIFRCGIDKRNRGCDSVSDPFRMGCVVLRAL